ncbi:hypothetical protein WH43_14250 [Rheinheimera sp. KL1]|uniref:hypothetical protein n=1 Tax=Rheinheimera sp. KL1 TaxID=1635005 RepID=UPI0006A949DE|nr:hypothetical protein [Rheinheimera sp. KL1]KOO57251.1 hypothetical protein WH43_14250 [Rheinheimera sp. KL1]
MIKHDSVQLEKILINTENPRFPEPQDGERSAINKMIELQGDRIVQLARDICEYGLDPTEKIIVIPHISEKEHFTVLEGNRRITVLKTLKEPNLINDDLGKFKDVFAKLSKTINSIPSALEVVIVDELSEAEHWIRLKHTGQNQGRSRVQWETMEQDRFLNSQGEQSFLSQFLKYLENEPLYSSSVASIKASLKATNLTRLLSDPSVRAALNLEVIDRNLYCNVTPNEFFQKSSVLLREIEGKGQYPNFTVENIYYKTDRLDFLARVGILKTIQILDKPWQLMKPSSYTPVFKSSEDLNHKPSSHNENQTDKEGAASQNKGQAATEFNTNDAATKTIKPPPSPERDRLIPSDAKLNITNQKCNEIFKEMKTKMHPTNNYKYSLSVMLRVFIEMSLLEYIENKMPAGTKNQMEQNNKDGLHDKVVAVSNHLKLSGALSSSLAQAIQTYSGSEFKSKGQLQQFIHNPNMHPEKHKLNVMWDSCYPLIHAIWK